jgi:dihydropteroate synthase
LPLTGLAAWADARGQGEAAKALLTALRAPRPPWAGRDLTRPQVMGIINVTPDSFSDGGDRLDGARAVADGLAMLEAGADILDVGGESTRPGAEPVSIAEEISRVAPVIEELAAAGACVSVDTRHAEVMAAALAAGASIVNDVTALTDSPQALALAADTQAPVVLMHMQGEPRSMQKAPRYDEVALDIFEYLRGRIAACEAAGLARDKIAVDVGIGFGKTITHNLQLLDRLALFHGLGCPLLLGTSRKSFIGRLSRGEAPKDRLPGSLATVLAGAARGVQIFRVHDVAETKQALAVWQAIADAGAPGGEAG